MICEVVRCENKAARLAVCNGTSPLNPTEQSVAHGAAGRAVFEINVVRRGPVNGAVTWPESSLIHSTRKVLVRQRETAGSRKPSRLPSSLNVAKPRTDGFVVVVGSAAGDSGSSLTADFR